MNPQKPFEQDMAALGEAYTHAQTKHLSMESLFAFVEGRMPKELREVVLNHISDCGKCHQRLQWVETGQERQEKSEEQTPPSFNWRDWAVAALLLFSIGSSVQWWRTYQKSQQPWVLIEHGGLRPESSTIRSTTNWELVKIPENGEPLALSLTQTFEPYATYRIVLRSADGDSLWETDMAQPAASGLFTLALPRAFQRSGNYNIELYGRKDKNWQQLAVYSFELVP